MRKSWDQHFLHIAVEIANMGTCARRRVGCVLIDERKVILATGFNGVPPKWEHCRDNPGHECPGANSPSGTNLDGCLANHAEINALLHCSDVMLAQTCYTTTSPCISCVKALLCTGISRIVFLDEYPQPEAMKLWTRWSLYYPSRTRTLAVHRTWEQLVVSDNEANTTIIGSSGLSRI